MLSSSPSTDRRVAQIRKWIADAEREGARSADMTLHLTHLDRSALTRSPDVAVQEIRFVDGDMTFLDTEEDVLAFTRSKGDETLLFVFNLSRKPVKVALPKGIRLGKTIAMPGFTTADAGSTVALSALDVYCGALA